MLGGLVVDGLDQARDVLRFHRDFCPTLPDEAEAYLGGNRHPLTVIARGGKSAGVPLAHETTRSAPRASWRRAGSSSTGGANDAISSDVANRAAIARATRLSP